MLPTSLTAQKAIVHLIAQELKSRHFFEVLRAIGLDDDFYQTDLLNLIMTAMGIPPAVHAQHYDHFYACIGKHARRLTADRLNHAATSVYQTLAQHIIAHQGVVKS